MGQPVVLSLTKALLRSTEHQVAQICLQSMNYIETRLNPEQSETVWSKNLKLCDF